MSIIDKIYSAIAPQKALEREAARMKLDMIKGISVQNSGYDEGGASRRRNATKGWQADSRSPPG